MVQFHVQYTKLYVLKSIECETVDTHSTLTKISKDKRGCHLKSFTFIDLYSVLKIFLKTH